MNRLLREVGPISDVTPDFPLAAAALAPLRAKSETAGSPEFTPLWSGQAARLSRELPAAELTKRLAREAQFALNHRVDGSPNVLVQAEALRVLAQAEAVRR